jgi:hypothetical protein
MPPAIHTERLTERFGSITAVEGAWVTISPETSIYSRNGKDFNSDTHTQPKRSPIFQPTKRSMVKSWLSATREF